jgi:protein TonB
MSVVLHSLAIIALLALPLVFHDVLPESNLLTFLMPPPPIAPPPPQPPVVASKPQTVVAKYSVPTELPKSIPPPPQEEPPVVAIPAASGSVIGSNAGAIVGSPFGIPGGVVGNLPPLPPLPPPKQIEQEPPPAPKVVKPIYVGGDIQAAKLVYKQPVSYPDIALKARISGIVLLRITVDEAGKVTDIKVVSGHPLLVPAAIEAVSHWKYSPTILNGHSVPVIATVAVNFSLQ